VDAGLPRVVIVGCGFGGLYAARELAGAPVRLTVIDRRNHHLFQPLLYQVATASLNPADIAAPIRRVLRRQRNAEVALAEVSGVDLPGRRVLVADGAIEYDRLIVATGATHSYFGHPEWARAAPGLKSIEDALEIRRRLLTAYERAERESDPALQRAWLTFVVIGAGPTGVELAGAIAEIAHHALAADFRHIAPERSRVLLLEAAPRVLPTYPAGLSTSAERQLRRLGVEVRTGTIVTGVDDGGVRLAGEWVAARTVLWAAGVQASPLARSLATALDRAGRVRVNPDLSLPGHPEVAVIGDLATLDQDGSPVPGVAQAAIQEGRHAARNIVRSLRGHPPVAFRYSDRGSMATIGRASAVADFGRLRLSGAVAWLSWLFVHILFLIGFRNRAAVILEWAWSYFTFDRGARLITDTALQWRPTVPKGPDPDPAPAQKPPS
jgi:NADH:ubiquinone reductase (H+-translocating)